MKEAPKKLEQNKNKQCALNFTKNKKKEVMGKFFHQKEIREQVATSTNKNFEPTTIPFVGYISIHSTTSLLNFLTENLHPSNEQKYNFFSCIL